MSEQCKHIIVADDEEHIRTSVSFVLEDAGYKVTTVGNGVEALERIKAYESEGRPADLLLTDVQMPHMNGLELVDELNNQSIELPVLVITGYGDKETVVELMRKGCVDYLDKPLLPEAILERTAEALENAERARSLKLKWERSIERTKNRLNRDLDSYRRNFKHLREQMDSAAYNYHKLVSVDTSQCKAKLAIRNRPLADCGGDFFDYRNTTGGCDLFIADVAGHDFGTSYHTVLLKAFFDENYHQNQKGPQFLQLLNEQLRDHGKNERMVTGQFFRLNLKLMTGELVSAGHPHPVRLRAALPVPTPLLVRGDVLGIHETVSFESRTFPVAPGDRFFFHTDGLLRAARVDSLSGRKTRLNGDGLDDLIAKHASLSLEQMVENIWDEVLAFCRHKPEDDMMLVGLEIPQTESDASSRH